MISDEKPSGQLVLQTLAMPMNTNPNGDIFGGWLVSQMDLGASILAKQFSKSRTTTVALDSMVFRRPVQVGDVVSCYGEFIKHGRTSMTIKMEAWVLRQTKDLLEQVTEGVFTFVAINERGEPHPANPAERI